MNKGLKIVKNRFRNVATFAVAGFLGLALGIVAPYYIKSADIEATSGTSKASTLTFTPINDVASVDLSVTSASGTFATSTDARMAKFSIATDNATGYTLTLRSSSNTGTLVKSDDSNTTISSITSAITADAFSTASNTTYNNKWGYKPNYYNSALNSTNTYYPSSTTSAILDVTSSSNASTCCSS